MEFSDPQTVELVIPQPETDLGGAGRPHRGSMNATGIYENSSADPATAHLRPHGQRLHRSTKVKRKSVENWDLEK